MEAGLPPRIPDLSRPGRALPSPLGAGRKSFLGAVPMCQTAKASLASDLHLGEAEGRSGQAPVEVEVVADRVDPFEHGGGGRGDGQAADGVDDLAVLDPKTGRAPTEMTAYRVDAVAGHFAHEKPAPGGLDDVLGLAFPRGHVEIVGPDAG